MTRDVTREMTGGLRHLALRVTDLGRSRAFYEHLLGMRVVWEPDECNVYLSSGADNLALHQIPQVEIKNVCPSTGQLLDHLGFILDSPTSVDRVFEQSARIIQDYGGRIVKPPQRHRDDSYSFYMADPDGNVIQMLYEPTISALEFVSNKED